jgi:Cu+-exporting ATPase
VHPDDDAPFTAEEIADASFSVPFTFPKAGEYVVGIDYASGLSARSEQFHVMVGGAPAQAATDVVYPPRGTYGGYDVSLQAGFPTAGQPATLVWRVEKDGKDVTDLEPYLAAAMHVAIVKDDLSEFVHAHGEVHVPGAPVPKLSASGVHNHAPPPPRFGPMIEAHPVFPTAGIYTVFAQFKHGENVITAPFTVRVE